jgi:hypothetical protein
MQFAAGADAELGEDPPEMPLERARVGPVDIAALAVHLITNTAVTGATFGIDGGQQLMGK